MPVRKILLFLWLFSAVRGEQPKIYRSAQEGGQVEIPCRYDSGYETYPKYFYKGSHGKRETLLFIEGKEFKTCTKKGKYELCDDTNQRILHVTIRDLNLNDAGTYWCHIDAYTFDPITIIQLEVYKAQKPQKPPSVPLTPPTVTSVQTNTRKQQQSATTTGHLNWTKNGSNTTSTPSAETHTGKEVYFRLAAAAVVLLLLLSVVLHFIYRKHRHERERVFGHDVEPQINMKSTISADYETMMPGIRGESEL